MKYRPISFIILIMALSGCGNVPDSKIEEFAKTYIEYFKEKDFVRMHNVCYGKSGLEHPRLKYAHENIFKLLGNIKKVGKGRIAGYNFSFDGNTYELLYDIEFERAKAVYGVKVIRRNGNLYISDWSIDSEALPQTSYTPEIPYSSISSNNPYKGTTGIPRKELIFPFGQFRTSHASSIVELPDGGLFAVWYSESPWGSDAAIWGAKRPVGAAGWTAPSLIHNTPGLADKNPVLYIDDDKKLRLFWAVEKGQSKLWLFWALERSRSKWHEIRIESRISGDHGNTWGEARDSGIPSGFMPRTHPVKLHDGRIIFPVYTDWNMSSAVVTSVDGGFTWGDPKYILYFLGIQPTVIQRSDLSLFALMRSSTWPHRSWQAVSADLGRNWIKQGISGIDNPGSSLEMVKLQSGNIALIFNNSKTKRSDLSLALSSDGGKTWPYIKVIEAEPGYCYPSIIQDRSGLIHVVYSYNEQNSIAHFVTDEQWIKG